MISCEPSGRVQVTGLVSASYAGDGSRSVYIQPEGDSGAAPYHVANHGLGVELGHFVDERLTVKGHLARRQRAKRLINVSSYGFITSGR